MIIRVSLAIPVPKTFSYSVPLKWEPFIKPYIRVTVPFHNRVLKGYVVGVDNGSDDSLKEVFGIIDILPLFNELLVSLSLWASHYYAAPLGLILKYAVPFNLQVEQYLAVMSLCDHASCLEGMRLKKVLRSAGKDEVLNLYHSGEIGFYDVYTGKPFTSLANEALQPQKHDKELFLGGIDDRMEHYLALIARHIEQGRNVLMLLPDYHASGRYFYKIISEKFKGRVYWYGSPGKTKDRMKTYFKARNGEGVVILGNKSAAFLPVMNNGLIIVERSEEDEYRNEEGIKFNAWMIALKRAEIENIPIVFGSLAPPLEISKAVEEGKFNIINKPIPIKRESIHIVRKKNLYISGRLPEELIEAAGHAISKNENIAVFVPRKDYVSQLYCLDCRKVFLCSACGGTLGYQKSSNLLICSACGKSLNYDDKCPRCKSSIIRFSRTGVEYVEEKLRAAFTQCRIVKVTGETIEEVVKGEVPGEPFKPLKPFKPFKQDEQEDPGEPFKPGEPLKLDETNESDEPFPGQKCSGTGEPPNPTVFIGTQALSKLYAVDVKLLILYGWEELLRISGYRAFERMYQIFMNLIDALRPERICFFMDDKAAVEPDNFMDPGSFYPDELKKRSIAEYPPYMRLFLIEVEKNDQETCQRLAKKIQALSEKEGFDKYITGSLIQKRGYRYQYRVILKIPEGDSTPEGLSELYNFSGIRIEPDPTAI